MNPPRILGLYSPAPGCGKSTLASSLVANSHLARGESRGLIPVHSFLVVPFADPLKLMIVQFLRCAGYTHQEATTYCYFNKEEIIPPFGVSARHMLRTIGTEWGRDCIGPTVWIDTWEARASHFLNTLGGASTIIVDDVRFPNEADAIQRLGGRLWYIDRPGIDVSTATHASDNALSDYSYFSQYLINDGTPLDLLRTALQHLGLPEPAGLAPSLT